jgi:hypothetical protein
VKVSQALRACGGVGLRLGDTQIREMNYKRVRGVHLRGAVGKHVVIVHVARSLAAW